MPCRLFSPALLYDATGRRELGHAGLCSPLPLGYHLRCAPCTCRRHPPEHLHICEGSSTAERRDPLAADPARCIDCPQSILLLLVSDQVGCYGLSDV